MIYLLIYDIDNMLLKKKVNKKLKQVSLKDHFRTRRSFLSQTD